MKTKKNIASTLQRAREERGQSVEEFSAELNIAKSTLQAYLKGGENSNPTIDTLRLIAEKLDMTVVDVLSDPGAPEARPPQCAHCLAAEIERLHPLLREPMKNQLEAYQRISRILYKEDCGT